MPSTGLRRCSISASRAISNFCRSGSIGAALGWYGASLYVAGSMSLPPDRMMPSHRSTYIGMSDTSVLYGNRIGNPPARSTLMEYPQGDSYWLGLSCVSTVMPIKGRRLLMAAILCIEWVFVKGAVAIHEHQ